MRGNLSVSWATSSAEGAGPPVFPPELPFLEAVQVAATLFRRTDGGPFLLVERAGFVASERYAFLAEPGGAWSRALTEGFVELESSGDGPGRRVFVLAHRPGDVQWVAVVELAAAASAALLGPALCGYLASRVDAVEQRALSPLPAWLRPQALDLARRSGPLLLLSEPGCGAEALARAIALVRFLRPGAAALWEPGRLSEQVQLRELFGEAAGRRLGGEDPTRVPLVEGPERALVILEVSALARPAQLRLHSFLAAEEGGGRFWILQSCRNLEAMARAGRFDPGLWSRIRDGVQVLPPLRTQSEPQLRAEVDRLLERLARVHRREVRCSPEALGALAAHRWPGNWEELALVVERAFLLAPGERIEEQDLTFPGPVEVRPGSGLDLRRRSEELERQLLMEAYSLHAGNQVHMARALGISRGSLQYKMDKFGFLGTPGEGEGREGA